MQVAKGKSGHCEAVSLVTKHNRNEAHKVGVAKYDFLALKTVKVIRDTCNYINQSYPKSNEINFNDENVWTSMVKNQLSIFQFESSFASDCYKRFKPQNIFEMSLVTACVRPAGASYRDDLLSRKPHSNPSKMIDDLLVKNNGYFIYQEDTIKFLQQICGLSGSESDNIRRAIGKKQKECLEKAMPSILEGYCEKSCQSREKAEREAKEFLQIIEDSGDYQFGYNHSIAYCLLGYYCGYYRHYYPIQYITAYLNNAMNDDDIETGTKLAGIYGIKITNPKWGISKGDYFFDLDKKIISKGLSSIKYISDKLGEDMFNIAHSTNCNKFVDVLKALYQMVKIDRREIEILIKIDFFSEFGNQRELLYIHDLFFTKFKKGKAIELSKDKVDNTVIESIVKRYSKCTNADGSVSKKYKILDIDAIMEDCEKLVKSVNMPDLDDILKITNFKEALGYYGYCSGLESERRKLFVLSVYELCRKSDNAQFGFSIVTKSIGSGKESRFTVLNKVYKKEPIKEGDIIMLMGYETNRGYYTLTAYEILFTREG